MSHLSKWFIGPLLAVFLSMACTWPFFMSVRDANANGILDVDIDYTGDWYVETFNYSRDAENIRHFILVVPEGQDTGNGANWVFNGLEVQADSVTMRDDRREYAWGLDYLYDAPQGHFTGEFSPGTYQLAVAFVAAPLSRAEAGAGDDAVLWAGITGGGASSDYQTVTIQAGETTSVRVELTDFNGWACPWLYVWNGNAFERRTEILRNLNRAELAQTEITPLGALTIIDGEISVRIAEEKEEVTYLDALSLQIGGETILAEGDAESLAAADGQYLILHRGESQIVRFRIPASLERESISVMATGFYVPE